ncbi:MAG: cellulose biosynthesis protein BcsS, partial [Beijerinckiaceae bacterium]
MRIGAISLVAIALASAPAPTLAQEWYTGSNSGQSQKKDFGAAIDLSLAGTNQNSFHGSLIGTIAPFAPMTESGFRMRIGGLAGSYKYVSSAPGVGSVTGRETTGSLLGGYEWVMPTMTLSLYGGLEAQNRTLSKPDPNNTVVGTAWGFKTSLDFYSNPTSYTMLSGNFTYSTNNSAYYARLKAGWGVGKDLFIGPEAL